MIHLSRRRPGRHHRLRSLCRTLALVAQLFVMLVPLAEGREERVLNAHVEGPRTLPHLGHHADVCAACAVAGLHGRIEEPAGVDERFLRVNSPAPVVRQSVGPEAWTTTHSSRAPPLSA